MKRNQTKSKMKYLFITLLLVATACGSETVSEISETVNDVAEVAATVESGVEDIQAMATEQSELAAATPDTGPGTAVDNPLDIEFGQTYSNQVNGNNFERFYRLTIPAGAILNVEATNSAESGGDISFRLVTTAGGFPQPVAEENVPVGETRPIRFITADDSGGGTYLIVPRGGMIGAADFSFSANIEMQNDGATTADAPSNRFAGPELVAGSYTGLLGGEDDKDAFTFMAPARAMIRLTVENNAESLSTFGVELQFNDKAVRYYTNNRQAAPGSDVLFVDDTLEGGQYNILLTADSTKESTYAITLEITPQNDAGSGSDAGEEIATATAVSFNQAYEGFRAETESDCYQVATAAEQSFTLTINSLTHELFGGRPIPRVYDAEGNTLEVGGGPNPGASETLDVTAVGDTTYFCIAGGGNAAPYTFILSDS